MFIFFLVIRLGDGGERLIGSTHLEIRYALLVIVAREQHPLFVIAYPPLLLFFPNSTFNMVANILLSTGYIIEVYLHPLMFSQLIFLLFFLFFMNRIKNTKRNKITFQYHISSYFLPLLFGK